MTIRPMVISDYPQLRALWQEITDKTFESPSCESFSAFLERNPTTCYVAELGGMIVGSIIVGHDSLTAILYHRFVGILFKHRGIEAALQNTVIRALYQAHVRSLLYLGHRLPDASSGEDGFTANPDQMPYFIDIEAAYPMLPREDRIC
ncbi:MAG: hypothetical protein VB111_12470 [Clostridiaceae bacterium]|nr:hypothetical protein [Clostridiaceae bacterium]